MEWILVFLDTLFGGLVAESEWFDRIAKKFTGSVESLVYSVESGSMDASGLSQKVERLVHWLPIVFLICLALDLLIRSRFVRLVALAKRRRRSARAGRGIQTGHASAAGVTGRCGTV